MAPPAASLAVSAALSLYVKGTDKPAALARLTTIAEDAIERWPNKAEADDARIALGQASLARGDLPAAIAIFEHVNPRSQRFPSAMYLAGQTHWRLYMAGKARADAQQHAEAVAAERAKAEEQLRVSRDAQVKDAQPGKPRSRQLLETQLLLAEVKLESGNAKEADELLEPLVREIQAEKPDPLDHVLLRVFAAAARAQMALDQPGKAAATADLLVERGADDPAVNGVLDAILRLFGERWTRADAAVIEARTAADPARQTPADAAAGQAKQMFGQLLGRTAQRKQ